MESEEPSLSQHYFDNDDKISGEKKDLDTRNTASEISTTRFSYEKLEKEEKSLKEVFLGINDVVTSQDFDGFLQEKLSQSYKDFSKHLKEREEDLFRRDNGILVVGDTSAGKSTLINTLLDENILGVDVFACTKKIMKIIGSDSIKVKTFCAGKTLLKEYSNITSLQELKYVLKEIAAEDAENETTFSDSSSDDDEFKASDSDGCFENADKAGNIASDMKLTFGASGSNEGEVYIPKYTAKSVYSTSKYRNYQDATQESAPVNRSSLSALDDFEYSTQSTSDSRYSETCASDFLNTSMQNALSFVTVAAKLTSEVGGMPGILKDGGMWHEETANKTPDDYSEEKTERQICREVEIYYPSPKLNGNIMIVDSPGFGESEELDQRLREYLKSAVSFIFVADVNQAGLQKNGILRILYEIQQCQVKMFSFDPSDVIFVSNKWDSVLPVDKQHIHSKKRETRRRIKNAWPSVKKDHIFFLSVGRVKKSINDKFLKEYKEFEKMALEVLEANENKRAKTQFRFLEDFFGHLVQIVMPRYNRLFQDEKESTILLEETLSKLKKLGNTCAEMEQKHDLRIQSHLRDLTDRVYSYLQTDAFKKKILSEEKVKWSSLQKRKINSEVTKRIEKEIEEIYQSDSESFIESIREIYDDYDKIKRKVHEILTQFSGFPMPYSVGGNISFSTFDIENSTFTSIAYASILLFSAMRDAPSVVFLIGAGCSLFFAYKYYNERWRSEEPNYAIAQRAFTVHISGCDKIKIRKMFDKSIGARYREISSLLFRVTIPNEIENMKSSIKGLEQEITDLKSRQHKLAKLKTKLDDVGKKLSACSKLLFD